ncbi:MAG TPA: GNAT family N-acetyltransferase [Acidimicrobiales bacterium]|nr:GNAT family N-acetyltransferase [Acidimicrobiales bacterium]
MEEAARPAAGEDVPRLAQLVAEAVAEQAEGRGGRIWSARETRALPADASLAALVADPDALVLAGTIDGTVVGYAVTVTEQLRTGDRLGVVTDVYVEEGARGVGVGEALLDQVVAWCEAAGCIGIDALALPGNRSTKNFFESFGFTARAIVVHRRLR